MKESHENPPITILQYLGSKVVGESKRNVEIYIKTLAEQEKKYPGFLASLKKLIDSPTLDEFVAEARTLNTFYIHQGTGKIEGLPPKINLAGNEGTAVIQCYRNGAISISAGIPRPPLMEN